MIVEKRIHIAAGDDWGRALADRLTGFDLTPAGELVEGPCLAFAATEAISTFRRIDEQAFATGTAWSGVVLTPAGVRLGPVIVPGKSACYECFLRRSAHHEQHWRRTAAIWRTAESSRLDGWLPSDLLVAEGFVRILADGDPDRGWPAGSVISYQAATGEVSTAKVIGRHGCPRCRPGRDRAMDTWRDLQEDLSGLTGTPR